MNFGIKPCSRTVAVFIALLHIALSSGSAQRIPSKQTLPAVSIDQFLSGVTVARGEGYEVTAFKLGDLNVTDLFEAVPVDRAPGSGVPLNAGTILVKVRNRYSLDELRTRALFSSESLINVELGKSSRGCRFLWGLLPLSCSRYIDIPFKINYSTPCEEVTRVVYLALGEEMTKRVSEFRAAGDGPASIQLDQVFSLLLADKVLPFIQQKLRPIDKSNPCFKEFGLLKWLRNEKIDGFDRSDYFLHQAIKDVLFGIGGTLSGMKWERYRFEIELIGYADQSVFSGARALNQNETGIEDWSRIENPLDIYYGGCHKDHLVGVRPVPVVFGAGAGALVGSEITDNCELGAARAYVATAFLVNMLGTNHVVYKYGTGGIKVTRDRSRDFQNRRIEIKITAKSAGSRSATRHFNFARGSL